jgi:hypothetical protein
MPDSLITIAQRRIGERPGSYGAPPPTMPTPPGFLQPIPPLRDWFGSIPFAIVGGLATRLYMPARMTIDVDILVDEAHLPRLADALRAAGCILIGPLAIGGNTWQLPDGRPLDVIPARDAWARQALAAPRQGPDGLPYLDLPYLVLMKLKSGRVQDLADISRMLGPLDNPALHRIRTLIAPFLNPQDCEDLASLATLGRIEASG